MVNEKSSLPAQCAHEKPQLKNDVIPWHGEFGGPTDHNVISAKNKNCVVADCAACIRKLTQARFATDEPCPYPTI